MIERLNTSSKPAGTQSQPLARVSPLPGEPSAPRPTLTPRTLYHSRAGQYGPCSLCAGAEQALHPWCAQWVAPTPNQHPNLTRENRVRRAVKKRWLPTIASTRETNRWCSCRPQVHLKTRVRHNARTAALIYNHDPDTCELINGQDLLAQRFRKGATKKPSRPPRSQYRDPELPPPLSPSQYQRLLEYGGQLVLATYDPITGAKVPVQKAWNQLYPNLADVAQHVQRDPNALVGVVPASLGCLVFDVDRGDWKQFTRRYPPIAHAASRRAGGRHLYYQAPQRHQDAPGGFPVVLSTAFNCAGDVRCRDSFVVLWNQAAINAMVKTARVNQSRLPAAPAPTTLFRAFQVIPQFPHLRGPATEGLPEATGATERPSKSHSGWTRHTPESKQYWGFWWAQVSASLRRCRLIRNVLDARELRRNGHTVLEIAERLRRSEKTVYRWLSGRLDLTQIPPPWELAERAANRELRNYLQSTAAPEPPPHIGHEKPMDGKPRLLAASAEKSKVLPPGGV